MVGIGTEPAYKLHLAATPPANGGVIYVRDPVTLGTDSFAAIGFSSSHGYDWFVGKATTSAGAGLFQIRDQEHNEIMSISENGNVGIGRTSTTYKCEIEGSSLITTKLYLGTTTAPATDTGTLNALVWDNTTGEVKQRSVSGSQWTTSGNDIYYNTGKVFIGQVSGTYTLDVNGTIGGTNIETNSISLSTRLGLNALDDENEAAVRYNVAIGRSALTSITTGDYTTAVGANCGLSVSSGTANSLFGYVS